MDISTIMHKMQTNAYGGDMSQFIADVELIFDNCREFNEQGTEIVNCANILTEFFK
jgi:histone acetyltransferase